MMCRFADLNFAEQSKAVQQQYLETYEKRKARLQEQIDALHAKAEAEELAVSMQEAPDFEPEELPDLLPDETPDTVPQMKAGTLYPLLHGLEEKNFVSCYAQGLHSSSTVRQKWQRE